MKTIFEFMGPDDEHSKDCALWGMKNRNKLKKIFDEAKLSFQRDDNQHEKFGQAKLDPEDFVKSFNRKFKTCQVALSAFDPGYFAFKLSDVRCGSTYGEVFDLFKANVDEIFFVKAYKERIKVLENVLSEISDLVGEVK